MITSACKYSLLFVSNQFAISDTITTSENENCQSDFNHANAWIHNSFWSSFAISVNTYTCIIRLLLMRICLRHNWLPVYIYLLSTTKKSSADFCSFKYDILSSNNGSNRNRKLRRLVSFPFLLSISFIIQTRHEHGKRGKENKHSIPLSVHLAFLSGRRQMTIAVMVWSISLCNLRHRIERRIGEKNDLF